MLKVSAKHSEIVRQIKSLEEENGCTIYLRYHPLTGKIHPIRVDSILDDKVNATFFPAICSHNVAMTMENRNIVVPADTELNRFKAMKLNPNLS